MSIPDRLMKKIEKLEREKALRAGVEQGLTEIREILEEEPEMEEVEPPRTGRGGSMPPKEYQFKPGQSGNPGGRTKTEISSMLRRILAARDEKLAKEVVESLIKLACAGNQTALRELLVRADPVVPSRRSPRSSVNKAATPLEKAPVAKTPVISEFS